MLRYSLTACLILGLMVWYYQKENQRLTALNYQYNQHRNLLVNQLKRSYQNHVNLHQKNAELEKCAQKEQGFDWNYDISASSVLKQLQKN